MTIGVMAHSGKEKEVNQFVTAVHLSFNGIAIISMLLELGICRLLRYYFAPIASRHNY